MKRILILIVLLAAGFVVRTNTGELERFTNEHR